MARVQLGRLWIFRFFPFGASGLGRAVVGLENHGFWSSSKHYRTLGKLHNLLGPGSPDLGTGADNSFPVFSLRAVNYCLGWECL